MFPKFKQRVKETQSPQNHKKQIQRQTQSQVVSTIGLVAPLKLRKQFSWYEYKTLGKGNGDPSNSALGVESGFHH